jgi:hypothetical protein
MGTVNVVEHNNAELEKFTDFLNLMPKTVLIYAVSYALHEAMEPATSQMDANLGMHDSSNAAYNWRISYSGSKKPLVLWNKKTVVGAKGEKRSINSRSEAHQVQETRWGMELNKVYQKNFGVGLNKKVANLILYNSIDELNIGAYTANANIRGITAKINTNAAIGAKMAEGILNDYLNSGVRRTPNSKGLKDQVAQRFGNV